MLGYDFIDLDHDRDRQRALINKVMSLRVQKNVGNFLTSREPVSCSRRTVLHGVRKYVKGYRAVYSNLRSTIVILASSNPARFANCCEKKNHF